MDTARGWVRVTLQAGLWLLVGILLAFLYLHINTVANQVCIKQYPLTSQLLDCANYQSSSADLSSLDATLDAATALYVKEGKATRVSVWVQDIENKQWASSNENLRYAPASLLKLPLMIAYYKIASIEPEILTSQLVYATSSALTDNSQDIKPAKMLVIGQSYTVEELIEQMIIYSDNNAAGVLFLHIDQNVFENTLIDLGIKIPGNTQDYDFVTAKTYATIFRTLYNASYLTRDYSEKALELMSKSDFKAIAKPLPSGTVVADKFGEREVENPDGSVQTRELHDCGIVYKGDHPYTLCVMTEGNSFTDLQGVIEDLSKITWDHL